MGASLRKQFYNTSIHKEVFEIKKIIILYTLYFHPLNKVHNVVNLQTWLQIIPWLTILVSNHSIIGLSHHNSVLTYTFFP